MLRLIFLYLLLCVLLFGDFAEARGRARRRSSGANHLPENFYQAADDKFSVQFTYNAQSTEAKVVSPSAVAVGFDSNYEVEISRGFGQLAVGVAGIQGERYTDVDFATSPPADFTASGKGLGEIKVFAKGYLGQGFKLHYGLAINYALEDKRTVGNIDEYGNYSSGGHSAEPVIGFSFPGLGGHLGFKASYLYKMNRKESEVATPSTVDTLTGGHTTSLLGFYELHVGKFVFDGSAAQLSSTPVTRGSSQSDPESQIILAFGAQYQLFSWLNIRIVNDMAIVKNSVVSSYVLEDDIRYRTSARLRIEF